MTNTTNTPAMADLDTNLALELRSALRKAYNFGQTYWQQADSESWKQQDKAPETAAKFAAFVDDTVASLARSAAPAPAVEQSADMAAEDTERLLRAGRNLHDLAKRSGWPDDGEGAMEFVVRHSYELGHSDAIAASRRAPKESSK